MNAEFEFDSGNLTGQWNKKILPVRHNLAEHPLFTDEALATLIEGNPQAIREVSTMDPDNENHKSWTSARFEDMSGVEILEAVRKGLLWINIAEAGSFDQRYQDIIDTMLVACTD